PAPDRSDRASHHDYVLESGSRPTRHGLRPFPGPSMPFRPLPEEFTPNEITQLMDRKRRSGERILDLTETNPTRVGLPGAGPEEILALSDPWGTLYEPHPRGLLGAREALVRYYAERGGSGTLAASLSADDLVLVASTSEAYA